MLIGARIEAEPGLGRPLAPLTKQQLALMKANEVLNLVLFLEVRRTPSCSPGRRTSSGCLTYSAIVVASQVTPEAVIGSEYLKPSTVPALRPITPCSVGPTLFLSLAISWQTLHLVKTFSPFAASPSLCGGAGECQCQRHRHRRPIGSCTSNSSSGRAQLTKCVSPAERRGRPGCSDDGIAAATD